MTVVRRLVLAFLTLKLAVLLVNLVQFPVLGRPRRPTRPPAPAPDASAGDRTVSLLVPMRNEADRLGAHLPDLLAQGADEVIVLDDRSEDDTRLRVERLVAGRADARLVDGVPAPPGWVGKTWACHQLAAQATGSVLVFCDADVRLAPRALGSIVAELRAQRADVLSVFPRQVTRTLGEHLIAPLVDDAVLCLLPFALLSIDEPRAATANGSVLAFRRNAYDRLGGFETVRDQLVEDVALARHVRRSGLRLGLVLGGDQVSTRMYDGYGATVRGFSRGLVSVVGGSRTLLVAGLGWHLVCYTLPWVLAPRGRGWLLLAALGVAERALVEAKTGRGQLWQALLVPLSPVAAAPVVAWSLRGRPTWKDRVYP